jgi:polyphosphate kinase
MSNNKEANAVPTAPDEPPRLIHVDDPETPVDSLTDTAQAQNTETDGPPAEQSGAVIEYDFSSADLYLNRELTWLSFNARVLHEAQDERNPLLERVKFLAFSDNNLDEFVMKRIGGLKQQLAAGVQQTTVDGRTPAQQMAECNAEIRALRAKQEQVYSGLLTELEKHDIRFLQYEELTAAQRLRIRDSFIKNIFPIVTPLAMDPSHPFPFISNLAVNLLLTMRFPGDNELQMARVKVPSIKGLTSRLLPVAEPDAGHLFVSLDEVMANNLDLLFPGMEIASCELFRVTRNINVVRNEETATDLLEMIETELRERQFAPIVRLEVERGMDPVHRGMLAAELGLDPDLDVFESHGMLGMRDLFEIATLDIPELRDAPLQPADHPLLATDARNIFHIIRDNGPLLLQHPYQSFGTSVERFLRTASEDPKVLAIKMTLYRTSVEAEIIDLLVNAARNGKQVAVLVELKARFDEAANINRARSLEEAGIHVTYGVLGLKTHSKTILVVRQDFDRLRRYCHIGTGNYHPKTARTYADLGLITCDEDIGHDLTQLFNYLTGYSPPPSYRKILAAPDALKKPLLKKIEREISLHSPESPGHIQFKTNALEDPDVTKALYKACQAGVKVDLIVRDSCRFRPNLPGLSETATVISIVGRFLEHSRIYYFKNGGDEEYFIGSADLMQRNLGARVEVLAPVEDKELRQELKLILAVQLSDSRSAWDMQADGKYIQRQPEGDQGERGCQEQLIAAANKRQAAASKHKEKKVRSKLLNRFQKRLEESAQRGTRQKP